MAKLHRRSEFPVALARGTTPNAATDQADPQVCVAAEHCRLDVVPGSPVPLCGKHLAEVYAFANDLVTARLDQAVAQLT